MKNKIFVAGATGFQGANIARQLLENGYEVITLKRSIENGAPVMDGVDVVKGGLENIESLKKALNGVKSAVYSFPLLFDIELAKEYTSNFISAAKSEGISLVVFNSGFDLPKEKNGLLAIDLKVEIKEMFDKSGLNVITLVPDVYIDNIAAPWSIPVILNNKIVPYPISAEEKIPWISHLDLGKYTVAALEKPELAGTTLPIGGNLLKGEEIATAIGGEIGMSINFISMTPDEFEQQITPAFGDLAGKEISNLYRYVADNQEQLISKDFKKTQDILGVIPQTITEWVKSVNWEV